MIGGVAVAGAAAAVVVGKGGGSDSSSGACGYANTCAYNLAFLPSPPGILVSICTGVVTSSGLTGQSLTVDSQGNFNDVSSNIIRVAGRLTETSFNATMSCANGSGPTGSMTATGSGWSYNGTFDFAGSRGTIQVMRFQ